MPASTASINEASPSSRSAAAPVRYSERSGVIPSPSGDGSPCRPALTRLFRTPRVLDERVSLKGYQGSLRQVSVMDLGHEEPTLILTNNNQIRCPALVTRYAQRMLIENGIAEAVQFFHLAALPSMVGLKE